MYWEEAKKAFGIDWNREMIQLYSKYQGVENNTKLDFSQLIQRVNYKRISQKMIMQPPKVINRNLKTMSGACKYTFPILEQLTRMMIAVIAEFHIVKNDDRLSNPEKNDKELSDLVAFIHEGSFIEDLFKVERFEKNEDDSGDLTVVQSIGKLIVDVLLSENSKTVSLKDKVRQLRAICVKEVNRIGKQTAFCMYDCLRLLFCERAFGFAFLVDEKNCESTVWEIALSHVLYYTICHVEEFNDCEVRKKTLNILDRNTRTYAFAELIHYARRNGYYQLAYDVGLSWLNRKNIGIVKDEELFVLGWNCHEDEDGGVVNEDYYDSFIIKLEFIRVCRTIGDHYEPGSRQFVEYYRKSSSLVGENDYPRLKLLVAEDLLSIARGYSIEGRKESTKNALLFFDKSIFALETIVGSKLGYEREAFPMLLAAIRDKLVVLFCEKGGIFDDWYSENTVLELLKKAQKHIRRYLKIMGPDALEFSVEEIGIRRQFLLECVMYLENGHTILSREMCLFALIDGVSDLIVRSLRRHCYSTKQFDSRTGNSRMIRSNTTEKEESKIAYYTTLKSVSYLFDEMIKTDEDKKPREAKDNEKGINCFTVMNAQYMNDPFEGVALIKAINAPSLFDVNHPENCRKAIFAKEHLFLKSFTDQVDQLTMWNRYASDYDAEGKNSNGCCVELNPETFGRVLHDDGLNRKSDVSDDYHLYRVVYIACDGTIRSTDNKGLGLNKIKRFEYLFGLFKEMDRCLKSFGSDDRTKIVDRILKISFGRLLFLVKDKAYADEHESRMVIRKGLIDDSIKLLGKKHDSRALKLAVTPYFQVMVNKITLGPNVKNRDEWRPYLQSKLAEMWERSTESADGRGVVQDSEIPYSTT